MHLLILNFMARRWWLFLGIFAFAVLGASLGALFVFTPFVMVGMTIDQQQGWLRAVCGLPVSRRAQATAWWSVGVLMPVLVSTVGLLVGALIFQLTSGPQLISLPDAPTYTLVLNPKYFAPLFSVAVGASFGLGYAALYFLIFFVFPTRVQGKFGLACLALLTPLAPFGPMFIGFILPKNPGMMVTWHWVALASVPILALLSWLAAPWIFGGRVVGRQSAGRGNRTIPSLGRARGLRGMKLFLADSLLLYGLVAPIVILVLAWIFMLYGQDFKITRHLPTASVGGFMFASLFGQQNHDLRTLRSLPLSTLRLSLLRMFDPIVCGLCHALAVTLLCRSEFAATPPALLFFTLFFSLSGGSALISACINQVADWTGLLVLLFSFFLILLGTVYHQPLITPWFLLSGAAALLASFYLFKRGLRKSETYQNLRGVKALETA